MNSQTQSGVKTLGGWIAALVSDWIFHFFVSDQIDPYVFTIIMYAGINIILAVSLNLVNGFTGQFSMGHAGFMSVGAYTAAFLSTQLETRAGHLMTDPTFGPFLFLGILLIGGIGACLVG